MKRYFKNLLIALFARDPYRQELDELREAYDLTAKRVGELDELRYKLEAKMAATESRVRSFENLTENLRKRVMDKDILLTQLTADHRKQVNQMTIEKAAAVNVIKAKMQKQADDYEERMSERDAKIEALRDDLNTTLERLQDANRALGHDLVAKSMLEKTNNGLEDLYAAMKSGEVEQVLSATQYLDWSNHLTRIAQCYLAVLRRKNELVERLHFTEQSADDDDNVNFD